MAAAPDYLLMSVEEFCALPDEAGDSTYELHFGELVKVSRPNKRHFYLQHILRKVLESLADESKWFVETEMPFRIAPEYDLRAADVGVVSRERWEALGNAVHMLGSPEVVIEIRSRSNTHTSLKMRAAACLANGCQDFWLVDAERKTILVIRPETNTLYSPGQKVPVMSLGASIKVSKIFET